MGSPVTTTPTNATTGTFSAGSSPNSWSNPTDIEGSSAFAQLLIGGTNDTSASLDGYAFNLGLPAGAVVTGMTLSIDAKKGSGSTADINNVWLEIDGVQGTPGTSPVGSSLTTTTTTFTAGSSSDTWGFTGTQLAQAIMNSNTLGTGPTGSFAFKQQSSGTCTVSAQNMKLEVWYTTSSPPGTPQNLAVSVTDVTLADLKWSCVDGV
jgi:hypothetical protein